MRNYSESMEVLTNCAAACENCVAVSINDGKPLSCCSLCMDCADVCTLVFRLEAHNSSFLRSARQLCIEICEACAAECEKHADYHPHCKACMKACRECAEKLRA